MKLKATDDRVRFNYANFLQASGRTDEAIAEFRRTVQLDPDNGDAHFNLAVLLGPRNQLDGAITPCVFSPTLTATREHPKALLRASGRPVSP